MPPAGPRTSLSATTQSARPPARGPPSWDRSSRAAHRWAGSARRGCGLSSGRRWPPGRADSPFRSCARNGHGSTRRSRAGPRGRGSRADLLVAFDLGPIPGRSVRDLCKMASGIATLRGRAARPRRARARPGPPACRARRRRRTQTSNDARVLGGAGIAEVERLGGQHGGVEQELVGAWAVYRAAGGPRSVVLEQERREVGDGHEADDLVVARAVAAERLVDGDDAGRGGTNIVYFAGVDQGPRDRLAPRTLLRNRASRHGSRPWVLRSHDNARTVDSHGRAGEYGRRTGQAGC